jgi:hypothetical protein
MLVAALAVVGMLLFVALGSLHGSQPPDSQLPAPVERTSSSSSSFSASSAGVAPVSSAGASAPFHYGSMTFYGYACTLDCSAHEAGYHWGKATGVTRPLNCPNAPRFWHSFTEGCWAAAGRQGP